VIGRPLCSSEPDGVPDTPYPLRRLFGGGGERLLLFGCGLADINGCQEHPLNGLLPRVDSSIVQQVCLQNGRKRVGMREIEHAHGYESKIKIVRRQNISDIRFGKLREYLAHLV
jgi:hypothetical protein